MTKYKKMSGTENEIKFFQQIAYIINYVYFVYTKQI